MGVNPEKTSISSPNRRLPQVFQELRDKTLAELSLYGIIVRAPDDCQFASAPLFTGKKDETGEKKAHRFCVDYCPINGETPPSRYPMPLPEELFERTEGNNVYTTVDLKSAFHQVKVAPEDRQYTAFYGDRACTCTCGHPTGSCRCPTGFNNRWRRYCETADWYLWMT